MMRKYVISTSLLLAKAVALSLVISTKIAATCDVSTNFRVFDATLYKDKPDLSVYDITALPNIDNFWRPNPPGEEVPTLSMVKMAIRDANLGTKKEACINVEHWPLRGDISKVYENIIKYKYVVKAVKKEFPETLLGLYGMVPVRDYWRAVKPKESNEYREWQAENDNLSPIVSELDFLLPSLYTFYDDIKGWEKYATANLTEARRIARGKPIYAFLWPQYHDSNRLLKGRYIPRQFWRKQLETVRKHADGVVFWGGWHNGRMKWDEGMEWWQETMDWFGCRPDLDPPNDRYNGDKDPPVPPEITKAVPNSSSNQVILNGPHYDSGLTYYHVECPFGVSDSLFKDGTAWRFQNREFPLRFSLDQVIDSICRSQADSNAKQ